MINKKIITLILFFFFNFLLVNNTLGNEKDYFLTLNPFITIEESKIIKKVEFTHPFYDMNTINAQKYLSELQGVNNRFFCGSYFGYGFHEDGLKSGIDVANKL